MTSEAVRCNTGVELTVTEYLLFDAAPHARHTVPRRLHCDLQDAHQDAHVAFARSPGTARRGGCGGTTVNGLRSSWSAALPVTQTAVRTARTATVSCRRIIVVGTPGSSCALPSIWPPAPVLDLSLPEQQPVTRLDLVPGALFPG